MRLIPRKELSEHLTRMDMAESVTFPIEFARNLVMQAMQADAGVATVEDCTIPRLANCGRYMAMDNAGQRYYLNHANTWQAYQGDEPEQASQPTQGDPCFCDRVYPKSNPDASCGDCPKRDYKSREVAQAAVHVPMANFGGVIPNAIRGYLRRCSSGGMPKEHIDIVQANVDEADRLGYFKLAIAQTLKLAIGAGTMQVGGRYKWKHQDERLVYLGVEWSGDRFWHQFALVIDPGEVWCEVPSSDLHLFELDTRP